MTKKRNVQYERSLITYVDILGFRKLIGTKTANEISRLIRIVRESVEPAFWKTPNPRTTADQYIQFSDLSIIWVPLHHKITPSASAAIVGQILHLVRAQSVLLIQEGVLIRGGITIGDAVRSHGQLYGPAVVRAYQLENSVAKFPRIVVGIEVLQKLESDSSLWLDHQKSDLVTVSSLLRKDSDGEYFVDYLRILDAELMESTKYKKCLKKHNERINYGLDQYRDDPSIVSKYQWLRDYHDSTIAEWRPW